MGRKRINPRLKKVPFPISIAQGDLADLKEIAEKKDVTISSIVVSLIKGYINKNGKFLEEKG